MAKICWTRFSTETEKQSTRQMAVLYTWKTCEYESTQVASFPEKSRFVDIVASRKISWHFRVWKLSYWLPRPDAVGPPRVQNAWGEKKHGGLHRLVLSPTDLDVSGRFAVQRTYMTVSQHCTARLSIGHHHLRHHFIGSTVLLLPTEPRRRPPSRLTAQYSPLMNLQPLWRRCAARLYPRMRERDFRRPYEFEIGRTSGHRFEGSCS